MTTRKGPPSPLLTPQGLTPKITTDYSTQTLSPKPSAGYSTKLWDARPSKYSQNIIKKVCVFIFLLTICEEVASYAVNQSLKNFFQRLDWWSSSPWVLCLSPLQPYRQFAPHSL